MNTALQVNCVWVNYLSKITQPGMANNLWLITLLFPITVSITCPECLKIFCAIIIVRTELYVCIGHDLVNCIGLLKVEALISATICTAVIIL